MSNVVPIRPGIVDRRVAMLWDRYVILWRGFLETPTPDQVEALLYAHDEWAAAYLGDDEATSLAMESFRQRVTKLLEGDDEDALYLSRQLR